MRLTGTQSGDAAEAAEGVQAVAERDEGHAGPWADHRVDVAPLIGFHVEHFHRVEHFLAVEAADDVDLVVQRGRAGVRALPMHGWYHLPLIPLRFITLAGTHPGAAIVSAERVNLATLNARN